MHYCLTRLNIELDTLLQDAHSESTSINKKRTRPRYQLYPKSGFIVVFFIVCTRTCGISVRGSVCKLFFLCFPKFYKSVATSLIKNYQKPLKTKQKRPLGLPLVALFNYGANRGIRTLE